MGLADELQKLEDLRRRGTLSDTEFEQAKAVLLIGGAAPATQPFGQHLSDLLAEVRYQNELARIDREWESERQQYLVANLYGQKFVPTSGMGIGSAVVGGVFGVIWTVMAVSIARSAPSFGPVAIAKFVFPLFGILFVVAAIRWGVQYHSRALKYDAAFHAYQARREQVTPEKLKE